MSMDLKAEMNDAFDKASEGGTATEMFGYSYRNAFLAGAIWMAERCADIADKKLEFSADEIGYEIRQLAKELSKP